MVIDDDKLRFLTERAIKRLEEYLDSIKKSPEPDTRYMREIVSVITYLKDTRKNLDQLTDSDKRRLEKILNNILFASYLGREETSDKAKKVFEKSVLTYVPLSYRYSENLESKFRMYGKRSFFRKYS